MICNQCAGYADSKEGAHCNSNGCSCQHKESHPINWGNVYKKLDEEKNAD